MTKSELISLLRESASRVEVGADPGTFFTNPSARPTTMYGFSIGPRGATALDVVDAGALPALRQQEERLWLHVEGLADSEAVRSVTTAFGLHELASADIVNVHQRPKVEEYDQQLFIVLRMPCSHDSLETQQFSLVLGPDFLLTFTERDTPALEPVRRRLAHADNKLARRSIDYLAYAVLDAVVDSFFPLLETYGELVEIIETRALENPSRSVSRAIHTLRADLLVLRRAVWPLREIINSLSRGTDGLMGEETRLYLRDCYDHAVHVLDSVETYRELTFGLVDLYISSLSSRMNEIMKVLTIIATVFIPLSFIAGVYGMNFDRSSPWNLPELGWTYGYPFALGVMLAVALSLLGYFRSKGWIGSRAEQ